MADICKHCFNNSFASFDNEKLLLSWDFKKNVDKNGKVLEPIKVLKYAHLNCYFHCIDCNHEFTVYLNDLSKREYKNRETYCPFCSGEKLCYIDNI